MDYKDDMPVEKDMPVENDRPAENDTTGEKPQNGDIKRRKTEGNKHGRQAAGYVAVTAIAFAGMFLLGFMDNLKGALIPSLRSFFSVSYSSIGSMLFLCTFGYLISMFLGGFASDRFKKKTVIITGLTIVGLSLIALVFTRKFLLFSIIMLVMNIGFGWIDIGLNSLGSVIFVRNTAVMMNLLHLFFGAGSTVGPKYAGVMLEGGYQWFHIFGYAGIGLVLFLGLLFFIRFPKTNSEDGYENPLHYKEVLGDPRIWLYILLLGGAEILEIATASWLVTFLHDFRGMSENTGATYLSLFFLLFTIGRMVGGFAAERYGYEKVIQLFSIAGLGFFLLGMFIPGIPWVLSLIGFAVSLMFPTVMTMIIRDFPRRTGTAMGAVISGAGAITMLTNWLIGVANDFIGVFGGFMLIGISPVLIYVMVSVINARNRKQQKTLV